MEVLVERLYTEKKDKKNIEKIETEKRDRVRNIREENKKKRKWKFSWKD